MTRISLIIAAVICGCVCWPRSEKCTDSFIAKVRACEEACESLKKFEDDDDDRYAKCLWNGLQDTPLIQSYAPDCKLNTKAYNKECYKTIRRRVFFDCSLSKEININATCEVDII